MMNKHDDPVAALLEALALTPGNVVLRRHIAETLLTLNRVEEAENHFREALRQAPDDIGSKLGLVRVCLAQGRLNVGFVLVEDVLKQGEVPALAHVLYAWLLARSGKPLEAIDAYRKGIALEPSLANAGLEEQLGLPKGQTSRPTAKPTEHPPQKRVAAGVDASFEELGDDGSSGGEEPSEDIEFSDEPFETKRDSLPEVSFERPKEGFDSVGGMEAIKDEIRMKIILPLTNRDLYEAYGKKAGGGILLYGPPGCGKTHLARATAGQIEAGFIAVGLHDVLDMWLGNSEKRLHSLFETARRNPPCVLFFDEVDALAASRADMRHSAGRHLINQFLSELDGLNASNEGVLILAATNAPWHLDAAFRRPGRFDRIIFVPPPDEAARAAILDILLRGKPQESLDLAKVAKKTQDFSGADLRGLVDVAIEEKLRLAMKSGKMTPLETKDLLAGAKRQKPSTKEWFATARNHALFANEGGIYDDIIEYLGLK